VARLIAARWFDPAVALAVATLGLVELAVRPGMEGAPLAPVVVVLCLPLAARRRRPVVAACAIAAVAPFVTRLDGSVPYSSGLTACLLAYSCGAHASLRAGALGVGALLLAYEVAIGVPEGEPVPFVFMTLAPFWVGRQVRLRRELVRALAERTRELEAEEDAFARLAARHERARIARELHDIVAHHLAVIVVQAVPAAWPRRRGAIGRRSASPPSAGPAATPWRRWRA
jgi:signal transduction histidine kinase